MSPSSPCAGGSGDTFPAISGNPLAEDEMISLIFPAHNEEQFIGASLSSIRTTMVRVAEPYEVIVVDDASTDATRRIAGEMGSRTLTVAHRKIAAVRNAGTGGAGGDIFFFVDADTQINERAVTASLAALRPAAAGCLTSLKNEPKPSNIAARHLASGVPLMLFPVLMKQGLGVV